MADVVALGRRRLPGEVVGDPRLDGPSRPTSTPAAWPPGDPVEPRGAAAVGATGPGLLGGVFDGLLRPLPDAPTWLVPGAEQPHDGADLALAARCRRGRRGRRRATVLGTVPGAGSVEYRVLVPPGAAGRVDVARRRRDQARRRRRRRGRPVSRSTLATASWPVRRPARTATASPTAEPLLHRAARARPALPGGPRQQRRRARWVRHRQDHAAAADRQVVRRRRDRLRRAAASAGNEMADVRRRARRARPTRAPAAGWPSAR